MLAQNTKLIYDAISTDHLMRTVEEVSLYHRIQASPGIQAAAKHCADKLNFQGIQAELLDYPAAQNLTFGLYPGFDEWDCTRAWMKLTDGAMLADFEGNPMEIIQKSYPCDYRNQDVEVVFMDRGTDMAAYEDVDLTGKIVFCHEDFRSFYWAVQEKGAIGFLTDNVMIQPGARDRISQYDTHRYTSFWWENWQKPAFGFVLTPREGDQFEILCKKLRAEGKYPTVRCYVEARLYPGKLENATAILPGETDEEILITAHLCHPQQSANDNASGVAAAMEALRALKYLMDEGKLPPLKRTIRILLIPEVTGTHAYLDKLGDARKKILAGVNLDMVGGAQKAGYGPLTLTLLPHSTPSFVGDLGACIFKELQKDFPGAVEGTMIPLRNMYISEYSDGSDHGVLSDPQTGIPAVMLGQWPDHFYHTAGDRVEVIDPFILRKSAAFAASYAYTLANLDADDFLTAADQGLLRLTELLTRKENDAREGKLSETDRIDTVRKFTAFYQDALWDVKRFLPTDDAIIQKRSDRLAAVAEAVSLGALSAPVSEVAVDPKYTYVPRRKYFQRVLLQWLKGHATDEELPLIRAVEQANAASPMGDNVLINNYIDGSRNLYDIHRAVYLDTGVSDIDVLDQYVKLLARLDKIEILD